MEEVPNRGLKMLFVRISKELSNNSMQRRSSRLKFRIDCLHEGPLSLVAVSTCAEGSPMLEVQQISVSKALRGNNREGWHHKPRPAPLFPS